MNSEPTESSREASRQTKQPSFTSSILVGTVVLAFIGQATGLVSVLRHSSQWDAKNVRAETLQVEIARLSNTVITASTQSSDALRETEASLSRLREAQEDEQALLNKVNPMREQLRGAQQEFSKLQAELSKSTGQRDAAAQVVKDLEKKKSQLVGEVADLEGKRTASEKLGAIAAEKWVRLEKELSVSQTKHDEFAALLARVEELERQRGGLLTEMGSLKKQLDEARTTLVTAQSALAATTRDLAAAQKGAQAERVELAATQARKRDLQTEIQQLQDEAKKLATDKAKATAALEATQTSLTTVESKLAGVQKALSQEAPNAEVLIKLREAVRLQIEQLTKELRDLIEAGKQVKTAREAQKPANP